MNASASAAGSACSRDESDTQRHPAAQNSYPYLEEVARHLDEQLQCREFQDLDASVNGLQVGKSRRRVRKVVAAVDASLESFERAADLAADLLIVHHGIFWGQCSPVVGPSYERLASLVEKQLALYAAHLPLDAHLRYGNNIHLAERLGLQNVCVFARYKGSHIGCAGDFARPHSMADICQLLNVPDTALRLEFSRKAKASGVRSVAIVSGAGALAIEEAAAKGYELLLTGEIAHQHYHAARELGLSVLAMGHYRSETGGVMRLLAMLGEQWPCLSTDFIDLPTGL